jgi:nitroreductase
VDFLELAKSRKSIRHFKEDEIPNEFIHKLIEAAIAAPSAGNCQPWHFFIVKNKDIIMKIRKESCRQDFIAKAPVVLVVCADVPRSEKKYPGRGKGLYYIQDTAAATQNILLSAQSLGLSTCWCGHFNEKKLADILGLNTDLRPMAILPVGYSKKDDAKTKRRPFDEIHTFIE